MSITPSRFITYFLWLHLLSPKQNTTFTHLRLHSNCLFGSNSPGNFQSIEVQRMILLRWQKTITAKEYVKNIETKIIQDDSKSYDTVLIKPKIASKKTEYTTLKKFESTRIQTTMWRLKRDKLKRNMYGVRTQNSPINKTNEKL